jgi:hypothetical protein
MKNREIKLKEEKERIIHNCDVCVVSMVDKEGYPYSIPMNFGYSENTIILHSSKEGKKIEILKHNSNVCIVFSTDHELTKQSEKVACSYSMKYRSVLAYGKVEFIMENSEKIKYLNVLMKNYTEKSFTYSDPAINGVCVMKVNIEKLEARAYGY